MRGPKITELGKLSFLDDGGLVASVISDRPPSRDESACAVSCYWALADKGEPSEDWHIRFRLARLELKRGKGPRLSYCVEVLPNAYEWPGIPKLDLPKEYGIKWREACVA